jgi:hypothetical protein
MATSAILGKESGTDDEAMDFMANLALSIRKKWKK